MYILFGVLVGIIGFMPLYCSIKASKKVKPNSNFGYGSLMLLGVFASILVIFVGVLICFFLDKDNLVVFALSVAIALSFIAIIFGVYSSIKRSKAAKKRADNINNKIDKDK